MTQPSNGNTSNSTAQSEGFATINVDVSSATTAAPPAISSLSQKPAFLEAQLLDLTEGEGNFLYYPKAHNIKVSVGGVFYLREQGAGENGVVVQVINIGTASYPQDDVKALFRLTTSVRAQMLRRTNHEPTETIDEFLQADFKVRAVITNGTWGPNDGRVVTRSVDFFELDPRFVLKHCIQQTPEMNIDLGTYLGEAFVFSGDLLDKINVITGMKGGGKSHITKGIIDESRKIGMSSVVFDINDNDAYDTLPDAISLKPGDTLKFRLDRVEPEALIRLFDRMAPFGGDATANGARASLPRLLRDRISAGHIPDLDYLEARSGDIFSGTGPAVNAMIDSYGRSIAMLRKKNLIMTEQEAKNEDQSIKNKTGASNVVSPTTAFFQIYDAKKPGIIVINLSEFTRQEQKAVVMLLLEYLKDLCSRQAENQAKLLTTGEDRSNQEPSVPIYPSVFFEEAHMYMEPNDINDLVPVVRHVGMNLFFVTNTPGALPDSVFRLADNVFLTRVLNKKDIDQVKNCGLADGESIESFARNLPDRHVLVLGGRDRVGNQFPLVVSVRDFGFKSGSTRSMWVALRMKREWEKAQKENTQTKPG
jgi:hypothetical protein